MTGSLKLDRINKSFGPVPTVQDVSFEVNRECLALLGPSGCGKTTTINMIAGFLQPDSGEIWIDGRNVNGVPAYRRSTGMVFQDYALFPHKSVVDNIAFGLRMRKVPRAEQAARIRDILSLVGLDDLGERFPQQLSGGQRQRVALARALVIQPSLLLLDEPLSNLDVRLREFLRDEIRRVLDRTGITAVFVTHDQAEAFAVADRVALMNRGRIVQIGSPKDLYQHPASRFVAEFFGECNFIKGRRGTASGDILSVETPTGRVLVRRNALPDDAQDLLVAVRPEQMFVVSPDVSVDVNRVSGRLSRMQYLGSITKLEVELTDGSILKVDLQRAPENLAPGRAIDVGWAIKDGVALHPAWE